MRAYHSHTPTAHRKLALALLVLRILANHEYPTVTLHDFALRAALLNGCCYFHFNFTLHRTSDLNRCLGSWHGPDILHNTNLVL